MQNKLIQDLGRKYTDLALWPEGVHDPVAKSLWKSSAEKQADSAPTAAING